jgi:hypothetical protein
MSPAPACISTRTIFVLLLGLAAIEAGFAVIISEGARVVSFFDLRAVSLPCVGSILVISSLFFLIVDNSRRVRPRWNL